VDIFLPYDSYNQFTYIKIDGTCSHLGAMGPNIFQVLAHSALWLPRPRVLYKLDGIALSSVFASTTQKWWWMIYACFMGDFFYRHIFSVR